MPLPDQQRPSLLRKQRLSCSVTASKRAGDDGLPPDSRERISCSIEAAVKYEVPANILLAVAEKEGDKPGSMGAKRKRYLRYRPDTVQHRLSV
jgi:hypothetical protein